MERLFKDVSAVAPSALISVFAISVEQWTAQDAMILIMLWSKKLEYLTSVAVSDLILPQQQTLIVVLDAQIAIP